MNESIQLSQFFKYNFLATREVVFINLMQIGADLVKCLIQFIMNSLVGKVAKEFSVCMKNHLFPFE
jgi:hypothetical protein